MCLENRSKGLTVEGRRLAVKGLEGKEKGDASALRGKS